MPDGLTSGQSVKSSYTGQVEVSETQEEELSYKSNRKLNQLEH